MPDQPQPEHLKRKVKVNPNRDTQFEIEIHFTEGANYKKKVHTFEIKGEAVHVNVFDRWDKNGYPHSNWRVWPLARVTYLTVIELDRPEPSTIIVPTGIIKPN